MPQMSPMNWSFLALMFFIMFILFMFIMHSLSIILKSGFQMMVFLKSWTW